MGETLFVPLAVVLGANSGTVDGDDADLIAAFTVRFGGRPESELAVRAV